MYRQQITITDAVKKQCIIIILNHSYNIIIYSKYLLKFTCSTIEFSFNDIFLYFGRTWSECNVLFKYVRTHIKDAV